MESMQNIHQPLDERRSEIRLIEIISSGGSGRVKCRLSVSSLEDNPEFAALSYVWGDPKVTEDIILNNEIFPVTTNLAAALKHVKAHWCNAFPDRSPGLFRIWADAICINQKDPKERSSQVNLMRDIYAKAELVLSWLGHRIDEIDVALKALKTIAKETWELSSPEAGFEWLKSYPTWYAETEETGDKAPWDAIQGPWNAIRNFFGLPYWQRVWIFQELVLGKRILFVHGSTSLTYEELDQASSWFNSTRKWILSGSLERQSFLGHWIWFTLSYDQVNIGPILRVKLYKIRGSTDPWNIFYFLSNLWATDPRDHIYGLLGLQDFAIVPDYRKDLCSVLYDLVDTWIKDSNKLDCLLYAGVGTLDRGGPFEDLPSWAPNFPFISQRGGLGLTCFRLGHADQNVFHTIQTPAFTDSVLHISGLLGPAVVKVHKVVRSLAAQLWEFTQDFVRRAPSQARGIHPLKAIFELVTNMVKEKEDDKNSAVVFGEPIIRLAIGFLRCLRHPPPDTKQSLQGDLELVDRFSDAFFNLFFPGQSFEKQGFLDKFLSGEYLDREMKRILMANESAQEYFRFIEFEGGYLGMAPRFSRPGDVVAILNGCKVPIILRKQEDHYILIGTCNIPGLMEGEAKELCENGRARFEEIQIR
jgi:hypothetical protein